LDKAKAKNNEVKDNQESNIRVVQSCHLFGYLLGYYCQSTISKYKAV
jgi:hypothetical protein